MRFTNCDLAKPTDRLQFMKNSPEIEKHNKELLQLISRSISETPIDELIATIEDEANFDYTCDPNSVQTGIELLANLARLGNRNALEKLAELGVQISDTLKHLSTITTYNIATERSENASDDWRSNVESLANILADSLAGENEQIDNIRGGLGKPDTGPFPFLLPITEWTFSSESFELRPEQQLIYDYCDFLVYDRINKIVAENYKSCARRSRNWPVTIPAVRKLRYTQQGGKSSRKLSAELYLENIELGADAEANIKLRSKAGRDNDLYPGSPHQLWRSLYARLQAKQDYPYEQSHLEAYKTAEERSYGVNCVPDSMRPSEALKDSGIEPQDDWDITNVWVRKAALLPPLTSTKESIRLWTEAAMSMLDSDVLLRYGLSPALQKNPTPYYGAVLWASSITERARRQVEQKTSNNYRTGDEIKSIQKTGKACINLRGAVKEFLSIQVKKTANSNL